MLRSAGIGANILYNYITSEVSVHDKNADSGQALIKKAGVLAVIADTFKSYGGVLSKLSQLFSYDDPSSASFTDCRPYSTDKTVDFLRRHSYVYKEHLTINFEVHASGSIGLIFKAVKRDGECVALKVQYVDLKNDIETDLGVISIVSKVLFGFADLKTALQEVRAKVYEELDYILEQKNHECMYEMWMRGSKTDVNLESKYITIPRLYRSYSTDKIIVSEFIKGVQLCAFIDNEESQDVKNHIGLQLVKFIILSLLNGQYYSDIHPGNFLVVYADDADELPTLAVTDYGCIHPVTDKIMDTIKTLYTSINNKDRTLFDQMAREKGLVKQDISTDGIDYLYEYMQIQLEPFTKETHEFTEEWNDRCKYKNTDKMTQWIIPPDMVYYYKLPYGLYFLLTKMQARGRYKELINFQ